MPQKISKKLLLGFMTIIALMIVFGAIVYISLHTIAESIERINEYGEQQAAAGDLRFNLAWLPMAANDYIITGKEEYLKEFEKQADIVEEKFRIVESLDLTDSERAIVREVRADFKEAKRLGLAIFDIKDPFGNKRTMELMEEMDYKYAHPGAEKVTRLFDMIKGKREKANIVAKKAEGTIVFIIFNGILLVTILSSIVALSITRSISKPLNALTDATKRIASGDFDVNVEVRSEDEIGMLADAFNSMARARKKAEAKIEQNYHIQKTINSILHISLKPLLLSEILDEMLGEIFSIPWLAVEPKGCIFIEEDGVLVMKAQHGLSEPLLSTCNKVPFGTCLCGKAASMRQIVFADTIDERHDIRFPQMSPHGHLCIPIQTDSRFLGIINLYVKKDYKMLPGEEGFLTGIADTVALAIERKKAEESLYRFRTVLDSSADGVFLIDRAKMLFVDANTSAYTSLGYTSEELLLIGPQDIKPHYSKEDLARAFDEVIQGKVKVGFIETVHRRKDGTEFPVEVLFRSIKSDGRELIIAIARDITERKKAERDIKESEEQCRGLVETSSDAVVTVNEMLKVIQWNEAASKIFSYTRDEIMGRPVEILIPEKYKQRHIESSRRFLETREGKIIGKAIEIEGLRKDGSLVPVELSLSALEIGGALFITGIIRDITERKKLEEQLKEYTETLEQKIKERTRELEIAKDLAEAGSRAKSEFLMNMSHELRTPLNPIIGFSEIMLEGIMGDIPDSMREYLKDIHESGLHLLSLIDDILDLARIEAGRMELELSSFSLRKCCEEALSKFREKAMKQNINLSMDISSEADINITADERRMNRVMFNLLSNAFKFTPDGGSVRVTARRVQGSENPPIPRLITSRAGPPLLKGGEGGLDFIEISVEDTGIGISPEDQKRLFLPFHQLETALAKKYPGAGLGLNLSKRFVELHGGRIWVESEQGKGSKFSVAIPIRQ